MKQLQFVSMRVTKVAYNVTAAMRREHRSCAGECRIGAMFCAVLSQGISGIRPVV
jgi:hypothetical protein